MKFSIDHRRAFMGNDISVSVEVESGSAISRVITTLDGSDIGDDELDAPSMSYARQFSGVGDAGAQQEHALVVTVVDVEGKIVNADRQWSDAG